MPFGKARYGATIQGFTNANPCVITVDSTAFFTIGDSVIVANAVSSTVGPQLNGYYTIQALTPTTATINQDTTSYGVYISGGYLTIEQEINPSVPLQGIAYQQSIPWPWFNQAGVPPPG